MDPRLILGRSRSQKALQPQSDYDPFSRSVEDHGQRVAHNGSSSSSSSNRTLVSFSGARSYDVNAGTAATLVTSLESTTRMETRGYSREGGGAVTTVTAAGAIDEHHHEYRLHGHPSSSGGSGGKKNHHQHTVSTAHTSSSNAPRKKLSHSRDDIEFWASLYAQHPVYTRKDPRTDSDLSSPASFSASPTLSSPGSKKSNRHHKNSASSTGSHNRAPVKVWQVLTKTDLSDHLHRPHHPTHHHSHASLTNNSQQQEQQQSFNRFRFERLPIKAPQTSSTSSSTTAVALSSDGKPFSVVFFFTIESSQPAPASSSFFKSKSKSSSSSRANQKALSSSASEAPMTLWYLETAFTRHKTLHEHMELMGSFLPNIANAAINGQDTSSTPLYIYETQILDFQQPKGGDDTVVLDLKLQSPEGRLYADFSYKFVQEDKVKAPSSPATATDKHLGESRSRSNSSHKSNLTVEKSKDRRKFTSTAVPPSRNELASPLRSATQHRETWKGEADDGGDGDDDDDFEQAAAAVRPPGELDIVAEEPDAGEHFMQATSEFFSKMGYWLYNSKVVQYMARDDRVRTKTAFPAEDIWMLGVCYSFEDREQDPTQVAAIEEDEKESEGQQRQSMTEFQESQVPTPPPSLTASLQEEEKEEEKLDASKSLPPGPILNGTTLQATEEPSVPSPPKPGQMSPDRLRYSPSMSLSHFATAAPRRSAATSSISCQEAQSHSHSRSASAGTTSPILEDVFKQYESAHKGPANSSTWSALSSMPASLTGGAQPSTNSTPSQPSMPTLVINPRSSSLLGGFSKLGLGGPSTDPVSGSGAGAEKPQEVSDAEQRQLASSGRKPGKRRITITELFSWDSNSAASAGTSNNPDNFNGHSSSVSALKNLMNSSRNGSPSQAVPGLGAVRRPQMPKVEAESTLTDLVPSIPSTPSTEPATAPPSTLGKGEPAPVLETPIPARPIPATPVLELPIPETLALVQDISSRHNSGPSTNNDTAALQQPDRPSVEVSPAMPTPQSSVMDSSPTAPIDQKRDRKRKTSRALVSNASAASVTTAVPGASNQVAHKSDTHDLNNILTGRDRAAVTSPKPNREGNTTTTSSRTPSPSLPSPLRTGFLSSKRQNSVPTSPSKSPQLEDSSTPSSSSSSPGSSLKKSWRSLSLSLATSAKSTLPFSISSPIRSRSPGFFNQQQQKHSPVQGPTGFGHEYDCNDDLNDDVRNENSSLISLPPTISAYMSALRPSPSTAVNNLTREQEILRQFLMDFQSRLWFMYRKDLVRIEPSFYTCDSGWGCMMRTGQSLLAQGFMQVLLGREWRAHLPQTQSSQRRYREILSWFVDEPEHPYSIHRIAKAGLALDKRIGEWFGPSTVAHALTRLSHRHKDCPLAILVPMDGTVRVSSIIQAATHTRGSPATPRRYTSEKSDAEPAAEPLRIAAEAEAAWKPVLLMIPTRFGLDRLTAKYINNLKQLFKIPQFLGIAGGRPGRSLYFVACQGEELFYYDPHFVKQRVSAEELSASPAPSFHCPVVRSMDILELDPSMLLGFLVQSRGELEDLKTRLGRDMEKAYPLLTIQDDTQSQPRVTHSHKPSASRQQHINIPLGKGRERDGDGDRNRTRDMRQYRGDARGNTLLSTSPLSCSPAPSSPVSALPNQLSNPKDQGDAFSIKSLDSDDDGYDEE